jgi:hypothetical protein
MMWFCVSCVHSIWVKAMQLALDPQMTREHLLFKETGHVFEP